MCNKCLTGRYIQAFERGMHHMKNCMVRQMLMWSVVSVVSHIWWTTLWTRFSRVLKSS